MQQTFSGAAHAPVEEDRFIRERERALITGISRSQQHRMEAEGKAPKRIRITPKLTVWSLAEVSAWMAARRAEPRSPKAA